jgi:hypothetical protein
MRTKNISENTIRSIIRKSLLEKKGLWDNIHAKKKRGEKPAKPGDEDYPDKKSWEKAKKSEGEECSEEMLEEAYELLENGLKFKSKDGNFELYEVDESYYSTLNEAEYQGRKVKLGKIMQGDVKKSKVYVKKPNGKVVKVNFGDPNMRIKKNIPARRKSFRARMKCDTPGPRWKARYWACRTW